MAPPRYDTVHRLLTNPVYAGAYVLAHGCARDGRRKSSSRGRAGAAWDVLSRYHHDGDISWEEYDRNQKIIAGNANMKGTMVAGSVRQGGGLLVGLLRCGHCGRKLKVLHHARRDTRYICNAEMDYASDKKCIDVQQHARRCGGVGGSVACDLTAGIEAALQLIADRERAGAERLRQSELALEQARYEETMRAGNMMRLIPITGWSLASSNADGMNASRGRAARGTHRELAERTASRAARRRARDAAGARG